MKKILFKVLCLSLASALLVGQTAFASEIESKNSSDIIINNPYDVVDWDSVGTYKSNLHTHTTMSDGSKSVAEMFKAYQELQYDFLAFAEHDAIQGAWPNFSINNGMTHENLGGLGGTNGLPEVNGWKTSDVLYIKGNEVSKTGWENHHFGSYFSDYVNDGNCETVREIIEDCAEFDEDGLQVMFHPGRYAYHPSEGPRYWNPADKDFVNCNPRFYDFPEDYTVPTDGSISEEIVEWYVDIYEDIDSMVGMEVLNFGNQYSRDRELWDLVLTETMPENPVWGFANDDAHGTGTQVGRDMEFMLLEDKNVDDFKDAMMNGNFYISSRYTLEGKGFNTAGADRSLPLPSISNIVVDEENDTITIEGDDFDTVTWISCGEEVATGNTISIEESGSEKYVRAVLTGKGGESFTQPFGIVTENAMLETEGVSVSTPSMVSGQAGSTFNANINVGSWTDTSVKLIDGIVDVPAELSVKDIKIGSQFSGGELEYNVDADGKLRFAYMSTNLDEIKLTGESFPSELMTITFEVKEDLVAGTKFDIEAKSLTLKSSSDAVVLSLDVEEFGSASVEVAPVVDVTASSRVLYTGDDSDLVSSDTQAVAVEFANLSGIPSVAFNNAGQAVEFMYSKEMSDKKGVAIYVAMLYNKITAEELNNIENYEINSDAQCATITFADTNEDTVINAQDALNTLSAWLRKTDVKTNKEIMTMNVTADSSISTLDVLAIMENYVDGSELAVISK